MWSDLIQPKDKRGALGYFPMVFNDLLSRK